MTLDRRTLLTILMADMFVMSGAGFIVWDRYQLHKMNLPDISVSRPAPTETAPTPPQPAPTQEPASQQTPPVEPAETPQPTPDKPKEKVKPGPESARNLMFTYRNSKPAQVEIIGSFNDWTPQPLKKGKNHQWSILLALEPGEYSYNYVVDGKVIRDPNNPKSDTEGRSLLTVKPKASSSQ